MKCEGVQDERLKTNETGVTISSLRETRREEVKTDVAKGFKGGQEMTVGMSSATCYWRRLHLTCIDHYSTLQNYKQPSLPRASIVNCFYDRTKFPSGINTHEYVLYKHVYMFSLLIEMTFETTSKMCHCRSIKRHIYPSTRSRVF